ncbi:MAG: hypothetical protein QXL09_02480 [Candidatus Aenigmatarchaeota archaeon]
MIIIDTNAILTIKNLKKKLEEFANFGEPIVLENTIKELKSMKDKNSKLALSLLRHYNFKIIKTSLQCSADEAILNIATPSDAVVTNDKKLIKRLKAKGVNIIRLRQKKYLILER